MNNTEKMLVGLAGSAGIAIAWELYPDKNLYTLAQAQGNPLAVMEHFHFGLLSLLAARTTKKYQPYLNGLGVGLIVAEAAQPNPFGIGKATSGASTIIGLMLASALALTF